MAEQWPNTLPSIPSEGYSLQRLPNVITTEVGSGPPKVRVRSTLSRKIYTTDIELTGEQLETFNEFFDSTLVFGTDDFEMPNPFETNYSGSKPNGLFNFLGIYPNEFKHAIVAPHVSNQRFRGKLVLEYLGAA